MILSLARAPILHVFPPSLPSKEGREKAAFPIEPRAFLLDISLSLPLLVENVTVAGEKRRGKGKKERKLLPNFVNSFGQVSPRTVSCPIRRQL